MKMLTRHLELFESLNRAGVEYLLVGGVAAIAYGVPRTTQDIDLLINPAIQNAERQLSSCPKIDRVFSNVSPGSQTGPDAKMAVAVLE